MHPTSEEDAEIRGHIRTMRQDLLLSMQKTVQQVKADQIALGQTVTVAGNGGGARRDSGSIRGSSSGSLRGSSSDDEDARSQMPAVTI